MSGILEDLGYTVIYADLIAKSAYKKDSSLFQALLKLVESLKSRGLLDKSEDFMSVSKDIDPKKLVPYFVKNPCILDEFESLIHPWVDKEFVIQCSNYKSLEPFIFYESALLVETGWNKKLHSLILVSCPRELRHKRLSKRATQGKALADLLESRQLSEENKKKECSYIIDNNCSLEELKSRVEALIEKIKNLF